MVRRPQSIRSSVSNDDAYMADGEGSDSEPYSTCSSKNEPYDAESDSTSDSDSDQESDDKTGRRDEKVHLSKGPGLPTPPASDPCTPAFSPSLSNRAPPTPRLSPATSHHLPAIIPHIALPEPSIPLLIRTAPVGGDADVPSSSSSSSSSGGSDSDPDLSNTSHNDDDGMPNEDDDGVEYDGVFSGAPLGAMKGDEDGDESRHLAARGSPLPTSPSIPLPNHLPCAVCNRPLPSEQIYAAHAICIHELCPELSGTGCEHLHCEGCMSAAGDTCRFCRRPASFVQIDEALDA